MGEHQFGGSENPLSNRGGGVPHETLIKEIAIRRYTWEGVPYDEDGHIIERILWEHEAVGIHKIGDDYAPVKASSDTANMTPVGGWASWIATYWNGHTEIGCTEPVLKMYGKTKSLVQRPTEIVLDAQKSLRDNAIGMRQPVVIMMQNHEDRIDAIPLGKELVEGEGRALLAIEGSRLTQADVLDLGVKDWTDSLIGMSDWGYSTALSLLGVDCSGSEKASGLSVEEVQAGSMRTRIMHDDNLRLREQFCKDINRVTGLNISVRATYGYDKLLENSDNTDKTNNEDSVNTGQDTG